MYNENIYNDLPFLIYLFNLNLNCDEIFSLHSSMNDLSGKEIKDTSHTQDETGILDILLPCSKLEYI